MKGSGGSTGTTALRIETRYCRKVGCSLMENCTSSSDVRSCGTLFSGTLGLLLAPFSCCYPGRPFFSNPPGKRSASRTRSGADPLRKHGHDAPATGGTERVWYTVYGEEVYSSTEECGNRCKKFLSVMKLHRRVHLSGKKQKCDNSRSLCHRRNSRRISGYQRFRASHNLSSARRTPAVSEQAPNPLPVSTIHHSTDSKVSRDLVHKAKTKAPRTIHELKKRHGRRMSPTWRRMSPTIQSNGPH